MKAIILAAGFAKRFGSQKLLMKVDRKPIILHVMDAVLKADFEEVTLVCRSEEVAKLAVGKNIKVVYNREAEYGISSSVICGVRSSEPGDSYMFFTGDQPFIDLDTIQMLITAFKEGKGSIVVPKYGGMNGNPVIFASEWKESLEGLTGDTGGKSIIKANEDKVYYVDVDNLKAGMDIDTWEDYAQHKGVE